MSHNWKLHFHEVAEPEEDLVTCEPIMTGWIGGYFSEGVSLVGGTNDLLEAGVGKWAAGGVLS